MLWSLDNLTMHTQKVRLVFVFIEHATNLGEGIGRVKSCQVRSDLVGSSRLDQVTEFCFAVQTLVLMMEPPFSPLPQTNGQHRRTANTDKLSTHTNGRHRRTVDTDDLSTQMNGRQRRTVRTLPYPTRPDPRTTRTVGLPTLLFLLFLEC